MVSLYAKGVLRYNIKFIKHFDNALNCNWLTIFHYYFSVRASIGHGSIPYWDHSGVVDDHSSSTT